MFPPFIDITKFLHFFLFAFFFVFLYTLCSIVFCRSDIGISEVAFVCI
ncbi:hypothetical protein CLOSYM_04682 [[Clostridium] symbiosum ATCC 14940]|uniref:Uncharacterized protein n=1 Tax=[Clostridium] symbiosum ATCC 14940 TaxID=411472 RepID=A0ABC9TR01_CLOSY|nr:hypothetical protein CLOSYM_04682 [[Clostridium] symbiosum ATCC 14940]